MLEGQDWISVHAFNHLQTETLVAAVVSPLCSIIPHFVPFSGTYPVSFQLNGHHRHECNRFEAA